MLEQHIKDIIAWTTAFTRTSNLKSCIVLVASDSRKDHTVTMSIPMTVDADGVQLTVQDVWPSCPDQTRHTHLMIIAAGALFAMLIKERSVLELIRATLEWRDQVSQRVLCEWLVESLPVKAAKSRQAQALRRQVRDEGGFRNSSWK